MKRNILSGLITIFVVESFLKVVQILTPENIRLLGPIGLLVIANISILNFLFWKYVLKQFGIGSKLEVRFDGEKLMFSNGRKVTELKFTDIDTLVEGKKSWFGKIFAVHDLASNKEFTWSDKSVNFEEIKNKLIEKAGLNRVNEKNSLEQVVWAKVGREDYARKKLNQRQWIFWVPIWVFVIWAFYSFFKNLLGF